MKVNFKKAMAVMAATSVCALPMMNSLSASAATERTLKTAISSKSSSKITAKLETTTTTTSAGLVKGGVKTTTTGAIATAASSSKLTEEDANLLEAEAAIVNTLEIVASNFELNEDMIVATEFLLNGYDTIREMDTNGVLGLDQALNDRMSAALGILDGRFGIDKGGLQERLNGMLNDRLGGKDHVLGGAWGDMLGNMGINGGSGRPDMNGIGGRPDMNGIGGRPDMNGIGGRPDMNGGGGLPGWGSNDMGGGLPGWGSNDMGGGLPGWGSNDMGGGLPDMNGGSGRPGMNNNNGGGMPNKNDWCASGTSDSGRTWSCGSSDTRIQCRSSDGYNWIYNKETGTSTLTDSKGNKLTTYKSGRTVFTPAPKSSGGSGGGTDGGTSGGTDGGTSGGTDGGTNGGTDGDSKNSKTGMPVYDPDGSCGSGSGGGKWSGSDPITNPGINENGSGSGSNGGKWLGNDPVINPVRDDTCTSTAVAVDISGVINPCVDPGYDSGIKYAGGNSKVIPKVVLCS